MPHTLWNILWYDVVTDRVKLATHARFDEGYNDFAIESVPPNVQYVLQSEDGDRSKLSADSTSLDSKDLHFFICPFATTFQGTIPNPCDNPNCGFDIADDSLLH